MRFRNAIRFAALGAFGLSSAFGSGGDRVFGSRYVSARSAALGDSSIASAESTADGLFQNPAALAKNQGFGFEPFNLQLQGNTKLNRMFGTDAYNIQSLSKYKDTLVAHPNTNPGASYALAPNFAILGLGVGLLYQTRVMAEAIGSNIRYRSTYHFIPAAGYGLRLASGVLRIGYSLQWVNKVSADKTVAQTAQPLSYKEGAAEGRGFSHNLGLSVTLPYHFQPSIHLVARNIAGVHYSGKPMVVSATNSSGSPADEEMTVDGAIGFVTKIGAGWNLSTSFTYRDGTNASGSRQIAHLSAGTELSIVDRFYLRGGFGNGYPSAGVGLATSRAEAGFAWFSEDLGDGVTPIRDLRYLFHVAFRAF